MVGVFPRLWLQHLQDIKKGIFRYDFLSDYFAHPTGWHALYSASIMSGTQSKRTYVLTLPCNKSICIFAESGAGRLTHVVEKNLVCTKCNESRLRNQMVFIVELCGNVDMSRSFCALKRRVVDRMWIFAPLIHQKHAVIPSCPQSYPQKLWVFFAGLPMNC